MRLLDKIIFILLFGLLLFISINRFSRHPRFDYHSQLWADKAGYHVYLPAFFYYDMDGSTMPDSIGYSTGTGFTITGDKIVTKYPIGVAVLHAPFFGIAAALDALQGETEYLGYTENQHLATNWSSVFYAVLGLFFLFTIAIRYWGLSRQQAYLLLLLVLGCTNLLYYSTRDGALSHSYSFFCFTVFLYYVYTFVYSSPRWQDLTKAVVILLVAISARHVHVVFLAVILIYLLRRYRYVWKKINRQDWLKIFGIGTAIGILPLVLQLLYNQYAFGAYGASGYENETFSNWDNIKLLELWFAPDNGAILYSPVLVLAILASFIYAKEDKYLLYFPVLFMAISLLYAAWWTPQLGCGFGNRGFTEFLVFFSIPIALLIKKCSAGFKKGMTAGGVLVTVYLFVLQWNFDGCWYGSSHWDWVEYWSLIGI